MSHRWYRGWGSRLTMQQVQSRLLLLVENMWESCSLTFLAPSTPISPTTPKTCSKGRPRGTVLSPCPWLVWSPCHEMEWGLFLLPVETDVWRTGSLLQWCLKLMGKHWQWRLVGHWQHWGRGIKLVKKTNRLNSFPFSFLPSTSAPPSAWLISFYILYATSNCSDLLLWAAVPVCICIWFFFSIIFTLSSFWTLLAFLYLLPGRHFFFYFIETHLPFYCWRISWLSLWGQSCCHWNWCGLSHRWWELQCPKLFSWC